MSPAETVAAFIAAIEDMGTHTRRLAELTTP